jgi:hypothetical protein
LLVIERKVLRTICGAKIENGVYRRRYNHDSPYALINVTNTSRLRYAGHMIRRPTEYLPQKAQFRASRNQGRPKSSWAIGDRD